MGEDRTPVLGWDAHIGDSGIKHAHAFELHCQPEDAVRLAMARAREKYGGEQEWAVWGMRAEPVPATAGKPVSFSWQNGDLRRLV